MPVRPKTTKSFSKYKKGKSFSKGDRAIILEDCKAHLHETKLIVQKYNISPRLLKLWIKKAGLQIPQNHQTNLDIVEQCVSGKFSPAKLGETHGMLAKTVRKMVKRSGKVLPRKYAEQQKNSDSKKKETLSNHKVKTI